MNISGVMHFREAFLCISFPNVVVGQKTRQRRLHEVFSLFSFLPFLLFATLPVIGQPFNPFSNTCKGKNFHPRDKCDLAERTRLLNETKHSVLKTQPANLIKNKILIV
jgi:hypothetical protein